MCKIPKQMFNNKIIWLIIITWLIQHQQIKMGVAGQSVTIAGAQQQNMKNMDSKQKQIMSLADVVENSSYSISYHNTLAGVNGTTGNKLNVNNTDTQMTLKLKDATARNAFKIDHEETTNNSKRFEIYTANSSKVTFENVQHKPADKETAQLTSITKTFANGIILKQVIRSPETKLSNNITNKTHNYSPNSNLNISTALEQKTQSQITTEMKTETKSFTTTEPQHSALMQIEKYEKDSIELKEEKTENISKAGQTIINNLIRNNNLINKTDTKVTNKGFMPRTLKDFQEKYMEKPATIVVIEKDILQQPTAKEKGKTAMKNLMKENEEKKEKIKIQANLNTTNFNAATKEKEKTKVNNGKEGQNKLNRSVAVNGQEEREFEALIDVKNQKLILESSQQRILNQKEEAKNQESYEKEKALSSTAEEKGYVKANENSKEEHNDLIAIYTKVSATKAFNSKAYKLSTQNTESKGNHNTIGISKAVQTFNTKGQNSNNILPKVFATKKLSSQISPINPTQLIEENTKSHQEQDLHLSTQRSESKEIKSSKETLKDSNTDKLSVSSLLSKKTADIKKDLKARFPKAANDTATDSPDKNPAVSNSKASVISKHSLETLSFTKNLSKDSDNIFENKFTTKITELINPTADYANKALSKSLSKTKDDKLYHENLSPSSAKSSYELKLKNITKSFIGETKATIMPTEKKLLKKEAKELKNDNTLINKEKQIKTLIRKESELEEKLEKLRKAEIKINSKLTKELKLINKEIIELRKENKQDKNLYNLNRESEQDAKKLSESLSKQESKIPSKQSNNTKEKQISSKLENSNITEIANQKSIDETHINKSINSNSKETLLNSTFLRQKRLDTKLFNQKHNKETKNKTIPQYLHLENSTEISHDFLPKTNASISSFSSSSSHLNPNLMPINDIESKTKTDKQTINDIKQMQNKTKNESVDLETTDVRKLKSTDEQKQLAYNNTTTTKTATAKATATGNDNNMMAIKNIMNNKQLDGNLEQIKDSNNKSQNISVIEREHIVDEINVLTTKSETTTTAPTSTPAKATLYQTYLMSDPTPTVDNVSFTAVTKQNLGEYKLLLTTALMPNHTTPTIYPLTKLAETLTNLTTEAATSFTMTNGPLSIHDLVNTRLTTAHIETKTIAPTSTTTTTTTTLPNLMQLYYTTTANTATTTTTSTSTTKPFLFSTTISSTSSSLPTSSTTALNSHTFATTSTSTTPSWPVKHASVMEGNVILGGLMMVHSREDSITCGPIMPQGGIQALEAMLYTLDQVNKQQLLPNITLGAHILDDCDKDTYGLEMAVDFIKGSISNIDDAEYHCNKTTVRKVISGVVGAASSVTSIQVANLLRLFRIPQVSFFSTSPELSNKQRFEYFSRTIPSDHYQVKAMVEIVKRMGWSYVSIIYEESNYGIKAFEELEELLARHSICIAVKEKLVKDSGVADEIAYDNIVQKLLTKPRARGAIIFGSDQEVREVMRAVRRNNATGAFSWIGSDGWSARNLVSDGNEPEVEGTLSVQPQANPVKGFEEYFLNLTVENNQRNPWFVEFWEDHFQCRYPGSTSTPYNNYNRTCTTTERLSRENTDFEDQLQFVSDAVMAFAYALRDMHRDLCGGRPSLCDAMKPTKGADLLKYLRKVQFQGLSGDHFRFDSNGDGPARYNIIHFKQSNKGQYHWVKVGEYYEGELRLNMSEVQFKLLHPKPPESVCSLPCERGQAKKYVEGESCCWHCFNCSTYQIRHPLDETQCIKCELGTLPDATKQFCQTIPEVYLRPESAWAIGAMSFSATGILVTLFIVGVFVRHNDTPIVRASGRELSYILLAGILMCYAVTFALVLKPTNIVCAIQRFSVGFCFTVVYAALLTKTNRIARIFKAGKQSAKRPSFISPKSQLVICSFFISIQILINGVWMLIAPSHAKHYHPTREDNLLVCDSYIDASYVIAFFYPIVLIVVCTVYAVLTRKIPEAFNESKHIGFTMYTTCVIWLAFVPLYFGTANHVPLRITSMSVTISLSASVTIACLFSPKLYIILIRPERNVRQSMMPPRYTNMHRTANTGPSSMMAAAVVTAATCAQEEKIQKHITPTNTEHSVQKKKLCEMATQTITITSIFTNLDSSTYNQIPYVDQYVPNNNHCEVSDKERVGIGTGANAAATDNDAEVARTVANNNKINQQHHHTTNNSMMMPSTINGLVVCATTTPLNMSSCSSSSTNHVIASTNANITTATAATTTTTTATTNLYNESAGCKKSSTVLTTSL